MAERFDTNSENGSTGLSTVPQQKPKVGSGWFGRSNKRKPTEPVASSNTSMMDEKETPPSEKWSMGILNDKLTEEVPGTVLLLSSNRNEPLGLQHQPERTSTSSFPSPYGNSTRSSIYTNVVQKKKTADGQILLEPQPDDSLNDPLNWPAWRRDCALVSLGFYCMLGGGMTPILAAGFNDVAKTFDVSYSRVALTTGLYMMGLGVGSVIASPTAVLFGKRPVYLVSAIMFVLTLVWCAEAPSFAQLATARVFQGISVSPVECLPSASIAEIFFLHERAFRIGIYTLLLLGGKNLIPLISAVIIQAKEWRWVFWVVAIVAGFGFCILLLFVPETFWDRTPRPKVARTPRPAIGRRSISNILHIPLQRTKSNITAEDDMPDVEKVMTPRQQHLHDMNVHARFAEAEEKETEKQEGVGLDGSLDHKPVRLSDMPLHTPAPTLQSEGASAVPHLHNLNSPYYVNLEQNDDYFRHLSVVNSTQTAPGPGAERRYFLSVPLTPPILTPVDTNNLELATTKSPSLSQTPESPKFMRYTTELRQAPPKTYMQTLKPWNGRLTKTNWFLVALRPFILFAYPSVLWSTLVYSLSVGWLIVLSESVSDIYRNKESYNFSALGTGLVYVSPFVGGVLGTAVAGKVSDIMVRYLSSKNGGVYEPEFRLIMAIPVMLTTTIGLMGYGWSAQERDKWIVPTIFFGIISFGCSLGSTTAITFCVDSYRQYAGEALVTLNFSKNIFHGLVFSLFFPSWLKDDGPKDVFLAIGGIQIACLLTTIPMYVYGKRARMWTVRRKFMENF